MIDAIFHAHSDFSQDGSLSINSLADLCRQKGAGLLFLTEHFEDLDTDKMESLVAVCNMQSGNGHHIIPGVEYDFPEHRDTHVLAVGLEKYVPKTGIQETLQEARSHGALIVVAHLSRNGGYIPDEILDTIHGCEIWNTGYDSRYFPNYRVLKAYNRIRKNNPHILAFSGSDLHESRGAKGLVLRFDREHLSSDEAIRFMKKGQFLNTGRMFRFRATRRRFGFLMVSLVLLGNVLIDMLYSGILLYKRVRAGQIVRN